MDKSWINASNVHAFERHGITCGASKISAGIEALHKTIYWQERFLEASEISAELTRDGMIRRGLNRAGHEVWQIHSNAIPKLREWVEEEKNWVSANNYERMAALGVTHHANTLDSAIAKLARETKARLLAQGHDPSFVPYLVEQEGYRFGKSEQGNPVWQIHTKALGKLDAVFEPGPWISSHSRKDLAGIGLTDKAELLDPALAEHFHSQATILVLQENLSLDQARGKVMQYLRPVPSRYGYSAWSIHRDYIPKLLEQVPAVSKRRQGDWMSAVSFRLKNMGVTGSRKTIEKAMRELADKKIEALVTEEMDRTAAAKIVQETMVSMLPGLEGKMTLKVHTDVVPELIEQIRSNPRYEINMRRTRYTARETESPQR